MNKDLVRNSDGKVRVAVYGTLKQGWGNHRLLNRAPAKVGSIGISKIDGIGFPIMKLGDKYKLKVEVYYVNDTELQNLDSLEGYREGVKASFYDRKITDVQLDNGTSIKTYVYEYVSEFPNRIESECEKEGDIYNWVGRY